MATRKKKSGWSLRHIRIEVNLLIAKVSALFSREPPTRPARRRTAQKARRIVEAEYRVIRTKVPETVVVATVPRARRSPVLPQYSVFGVDENGLPKNVIGDTVVSLASARRVKAVREGDIFTAVAAAAVEQFVVDMARKQGEQPDQLWR